MPIRSIEEHLRGNIVRRPTYRLLPLAGVLNESRKPKVANLDVHIRVQEEVTKFQIPMDDLVSVHVVACADELDHEKASFGFGESATAAQHVHERSRGAELKRHVDIVIVFEALLEVDDVGVLERAMDLNFCVKLGTKGY
jgi:hypothetical protein